MVGPTQPPVPPAPAAPPPGPAKITIDDFKKLELRTGKVLEVTPHSNADKLYVVKVDIGTEVRQVVAGIRPYYPDPAVLVGKTIVVVANLQPAMLRGVESNGMILAATGGGSVVVLTPEKEVPPGSKVS
jgi:methionyl-tRNA synthetase